MQDKYSWRVVYQDGTVTDEFDQERPDGRGWAEREDKPVAEVRLMTWEAFDDREYRVQVPQGATPVFFRRRIIQVEPDTRLTAHCIGWTHGEKGVYLFVDDEGSTLLTPDFQAV